MFMKVKLNIYNYSTKLIISAHEYPNSKHAKLKCIFQKCLLLNWFFFATFQRVKWHVFLVKYENKWTYTQT